MQEIDFGILIREVAKRWWVVLFFLVASIFFAVFVIRITPPVYTISMTVAPAESFGGETLEKSKVNIGGISGLSLSGKTSATLSLYKELLTSNVILSEIQTNWDIVHKYYSDIYDSNEQKWIRPTGILSSVKSVLYDLMRRPAWSPPDILTLSKALSDGVVWVKSADADILTASLDVKDPQFGVELLRRLNEQANEYIRKRLYEQSSSQASYISKTLENTMNESGRADLMRLLLDRQQSVALAQPGATPRIMYVSQPVAPATPSKPRPLVILILASVVGLFLGVGASLLLAVRDGRRHGGAVMRSAVGE